MDESESGAGGPRLWTQAEVEALARRIADEQLAAHQSAINAFWRQLGQRLSTQVPATPSTGG